MPGDLVGKIEVVCVLFAHEPTFPICPSPDSTAKLSELECKASPRKPKFQSLDPDRNRR